MSVAASIRAAIVDLNGQFRGKRLPASAGTKIATSPWRIPYSVANVDISGADINGSSLVFETGDQDGFVWSTDRGPVPMPWLERTTQLYPGMLTHADGRPFDGDPRQALLRVLETYAARGWAVKCGMELEFYLTDAQGAFAPATNPKTGHPLQGAQILSLRELDGFERFFNAVEMGASAMDLPGMTITNEAGIGQFEITLDHGNALRMADDVILTKELIKGTATAQGMQASFMAKPWATEPGNGMHVHFSITDANGQNLFDHDDSLRGAIGGLLTHLCASSLIFAPFPNSFARFVDNAHAPTQAHWGHDNRTVALRIPDGGPVRIEHRVAGGDVNPYLVLAAILAAALDGMDNGIIPPPANQGNAYDQPSPLPGIATDLDMAISEIAPLKSILPETLIDNLIATKRQEAALFATMSESQALNLLVAQV